MQVRRLGARKAEFQDGVYRTGCRTRLEDTSDVEHSELCRLIRPGAVEEAIDGESVGRECEECSG